MKIPRLSLAWQFLLLSFVILFCGMVVIGTWVGRQIETSVVNRAGAVTALYVDSFIAPHLQGLARREDLAPQERAALASLMSGTALGQSIVALKIWAPDGRVVYSTNPTLGGRRFPVTRALARALAGEVYAEVSSLEKPENEYERLRWSRLIEIYAPLRAEGTGTIVGVAEFYKTTAELEGDVRTAQQRSWIIVSIATIAMYLLLAGLVRRASATITGQQQALVDMHDRLRGAAARTTALNERFLRRIAADLHDGPGQDLALASLRIGALADECGRRADFITVHNAIDSALAELRSISAGLRLPELETLSPAEVAARAVGDYQRKTGRAVALELLGVPRSAPLPVKIALYRLLQESLANGLRHAGAAEQRVRLVGDGNGLALEVADAGPGFDPRERPADGHLGLAGMRERVALLGGSFGVASERQGGTTVRARLPLEVARSEA